MKRLLLAISIIALVTFSCKNKTETTKEIAKFESFGKEIIATDALPAERMAEHFKTMTVGDSINSKMTAKVDAVCKSKGCWMKLNLEDGNQVMVKFKDYGFFVPKDIDGKEVVINGKAFVDEVSVEEQRHYAEDAGKTPEEIAAITEVKKTYSFEADGVLLKQ